MPTHPPRWNPICPVCHLVAWGWLLDGEPGGKGPRADQLGGLTSFRCANCHEERVFDHETQWVPDWRV